MTQHTQHTQTKQHQPKAKAVEPVKEVINPDVDENMYMDLYDRTSRSDNYTDFSIKLAYFLTSENLYPYSNFIQNQHKVRKFLRKLETMDLEQCKKDLEISTI
jgi:hypothetical protein